MSLTDKANQHIPAATNKKVLKKEGETRDIIKEVLECYRDSKDQLTTFAPYLKGKTILETCNNIWSFWKTNIRYQVDAEGVQWIKTPAAVWATKFCDCKSFSVAVASTLHALGINGKFRFASYNNGKVPTHVYVVALYQGKEIIIDCVWTAFNSQKQYSKIWDYNMTAIYRISGLGNVSGYAVGELNIDVTDANTTQAEIDLALSKQRLELEQKIKRRINGIGQLDDAYQTEIEAHHAALGSVLRLRGKRLLVQRLNGVNGIGKHKRDTAAPTVKKRKNGLFKKIGKGLKKVITALPRLAIKKYLPKAAPFFLYTFITDPRVLAKLPSKVAEKKAKAEKYKKLIVEKLQLKENNFDATVRNGIMSSLGDTPEKVIAKWMKEQNYQVSGIGILPIIAAGGKMLFTFLKKIIGKAGEDLKNDVENNSPAPEDWGEGTDKATAETQANSGGNAVTTGGGSSSGGSGGSGGGGDYSYDHGDGESGNTAMLDEAGNMKEGAEGQPGEQAGNDEAAAPGMQQAGGGLGMLLIAGAGIMMLAGGRKTK